MAEQELLARLRGALKREPGAPIPPVPGVPAAARLVNTDDDLVGRFTAAAQAVGAEVLIVAEDELARRVDALLSEADAERIAVAAETGLAPRDDGGAPFDLDAGGTAVTAAIAETGTLVIDSGATPQTWSLLPPLHIAVVPEARIVPDLLDILPGSDTATQPSARVLVTGPSKTADIEGVLITGVHGPGRLVIMVVRVCAD